MNLSRERGTMRNIGILIFLVTSTLYAQTVPYPEKYRYLLEDSRISQAIFLRDTAWAISPLTSWTPDQLDTLYDRIQRMENNTPFPSTSPPTYPWSTVDLNNMYMGRIARSLYVEAHAIVPWSIRDLPDSLLRSLLDFDLWYNPYYGQWVAGGIGVLDWDATRTFSFCRDNNIVQQSQEGTVMAFADWCRRHLVHAAGTDSPKSLYDYDAPVAPLDRILSGFSLDPDRPYRTFGCGTTTHIWREVMRAMNTVVIPRNWIMGYPGSNQTYSHSSFSIPTLDLGVGHSDDFYNSDLNNMSGGSRHYIPPRQLFLTGQWWDEYLLSPRTLDCNDTICNTPAQQSFFNHCRRDVQLDVQYLTDNILSARSGDSDSSTIPTSLIGYLTKVDDYTFAHPLLNINEQSEALRRVDSLLSALGGGQWSAGSEIVRNRGGRKPPLPGIVLSLRHFTFMSSVLGKPLESVFTISNIGSDSLIIQHIGSTNRHFTVTVSDMRLGPQQSQQDTIRFNADSIGYACGIILIESNNATTPDSIVVEGRVRGTARLQLSVQNIRFGDVAVGRYRDSTVILSNGGTDTLLVLPAQSTRLGFTWRQKTGTLAPGEAAIDTVRFRPAVVGPDSAYIVLASNDPGSADTLWVYGNGVPGTGTGVGKETQVPTVFSVDQNYPNPFNPSTTVRYGLPTREHVTLSVFNTIGQQVSILQSGEQDPGYHEVKFDGSSLPSGVYFYRMQAGSFTETKKLLLVR
jgi:hypothetical protein